MMKNNIHKLVALCILALVSLGGLLFNSYMAWGHSTPDEMAIINAFLKDIVLTVVGFLAGSSMPDEKNNEVQQ
tara:strand:+ start:3580 stop:3798 length:219 start_codon:yes stop_codon:yes gene_type:complete